MTITTQAIIDIFERGDVEQYERLGGLKGFAEEFKTDTKTGIPDEEKANEYQERINKYGINELPDPHQKSWCRLFYECFEDLMLRILLIAAVISIILTSTLTPSSELSATDYIDTISIFVAVLIVSVVQAQTNYQQQKSFLEINKLKNSFSCTVIRGGHKLQILSTQVLVGDLLEIKTGDCIAADALFVEGMNITINNSAQTGESIAVKCDETQPFLRGGGAVESGNGVALVCAVGVNSQSGVTMMQIHAIEAEKEQSPLEKKLDVLAKQITYFGCAGAVLTFIILLIFWSIDVDKARKADNFTNDFWTRLLNDIMVGVTIFICAVPEGLPLAVTLSLSFSMKRMMKDNNFVRNLNACETMGGATTICSDKTGTLTQNKMTVVKFLNADGEQDSDIQLSDVVMQQLADSISMNSTASRVVNDDGSIKFVGSSSECALIQMIEGKGFDHEKIRQSYELIQVNEFNSARKRMSTIGKKDGQVFAFLKGAPDFCIPRCNRVISGDGTIRDITEDDIQHIKDGISNFAVRSLRTMLIAFKPINEGDSITDVDEVEQNMIFIALVGIQDPLRPEAIEAVRKCSQAGVIVRMVTGDFVETARAISKECGIITTDQDIVMEGKQFANMSKVELLDVIDNLRVLARSSPTDKYRLVSFLMECGEVVAVTGDGSNDSAALKKANVGLSMGICGTELAKVASDIVILDDNFNSIVNALKWGRCIYDNVRSFLQFQLTVNVSSILVCIIGSIYFHDSPLKTIQLLWINLIMDSLGALALATRGPTDELLNRPPYGQSDGIISNILLRNIGGQVVWQFIVEMLLVFGHETVFGIVDDSTGKTLVSSIIFNAFVFMQIFNLINARAAAQDSSAYKGLFSNIYFVILFFIILVLQIIIIFVGRAPFELVEFDWKGWVISIVAGIVVLPLGSLVRLIPVQDKTTEKLIAHRAMRREQIRNQYQGLTTEQQWNRELVKDESKDSIEDIDKAASNEENQDLLKANSRVNAEL